MVAANSLKLFAAPECIVEMHGSAASHYKHMLQAVLAKLVGDIVRYSHLAVLQLGLMATKNAGEQATIIVCPDHFLYKLVIT